jgi:hypothetical protein
MTTPKRRATKRETARSTQTGADLNHKRTESDRISEDIADFERAGGRVEKLGTTRVLQKVDAPDAPGAATTRPAPAKAATRKR